MSDNVLWPKEGRRQPTLIGRDAAGKPLPGGPYTYYQLGAVLLVLVGGYNTRSVWGSGLTIISQAIYIAGVAMVAAWLTSRIDFVNNNPAWAVTGWVRSVWRAITHPQGDLSTPTSRGTWKPAKSTTTRGRALQLLPLPDDAAQAMPDLELPADLDEAQPVTDPTQSADHETHPSRSRIRRPRLRRRVRHWDGQDIPLVESQPVDDTAVDVPQKAPAAPTSPRLSGLEAFQAAAQRSHP